MREHAGVSTDPPAPAAEETVTAEVRHVVFRAPDRPFAVLALQAADGRRITAAGPLAHLEPEARVEITGAWRTHGRHGPRLQVTAVRVLDPVSERGVLATLTRLPGIGERRARALLDAHGPAVFARMDDDPRAVLGALAGFGEAGAARAAAAWRAWCRS
jgi:hypothetical protein